MKGALGIEAKAKDLQTVEMTSIARIYRVMSKLGTIVVRDLL